MTFSNEVKALVFEEYAPDDYSKILKIKEIDEPKPKSTEVVFKVKAATINYDDIWGMRGKPIEIPISLNYFEICYELLKKINSKFLTNNCLLLLRERK